MEQTQTRFPGLEYVHVLQQKTTITLDIYLENTNNESLAADLTSVTISP